MSQSSDELNHNQRSAIYSELIKIVNETVATKAIFAIDEKLKPPPSYAQVFQDTCYKYSPYDTCPWETISMDYRLIMESGAQALIDEYNRRNPRVTLAELNELLYNIAEAGGSYEQAVHDLRTLIKRTEGAK